jgi:hypothetical protein
MIGRVWLGRVAGTTRPVRQIGRVARVADLEVHGELRAGAAGVPDHAFTHDNHTVTVVEGNVSVRWRAASDVSAGSARAIHRWFENYLFAMSVASGSPGYVRWTGQTAHQPDGHTRGVASITVSWSTVRDHPGPFSTYQRLASDIGQIPKLRRQPNECRPRWTFCRRTSKSQPARPIRPLRRWRGVIG